jgi:FixJ family two-component response regulator
MTRSIILHLEDDIALKETMYELITTIEPDSEVHQFTNSDDALAFVDQQGDDISIFLLDVRVPGSTDGIGVARRIRERGIQSPIVFMSAYQRPTPDVLDDSLRFEWINKPWAVEKLIQALELARTPEKPDPPAP